GDERRRRGAAARFDELDLDPLLRVVALVDRGEEENVRAVEIGIGDAHLFGRRWRGVQKARCDQPGTRMMRCAHRRAAVFFALAGRLLSSQSAITPAMASLFFSSIIMWPLPRMPISARRMNVFFTPACSRYLAVQ